MRKSIEAEKIIKELPKETLIALHKINNDSELSSQFVLLLTNLLKISETQIVKMAGGINSLDSMISNSVNQSFYRGRISLAALLHVLIKKSSAELERREESKKRK